jgi:hypothetical protein
VNRVFYRLGRAVGFFKMPLLFVLVAYAAWLAAGSWGAR